AGAAERLGRAAVDARQGRPRLGRRPLPARSDPARRRRTQAGRDVQPAQPAAARRFRAHPQRRMTAAPRNAPKNAVVILLDSLNRHMLGAYGGTEFGTPTPPRLPS